MRQQLDPVRGAVFQQAALLFWSFEGTGLDEALLGIIALEMACVHYHSAHESRQAESNDTPVVSGRPPPACLPAVHPLSMARVFSFDKNRRCGLQQILFWCKEFIAGEEDAAAEPF